MSCFTTRRLLSQWVKSPEFRGTDLLIASACLPAVNKQLFDELSNGRVTLLACPEEEGGLHYGKIATIIRSARPRSVTVVTVDGSPHCFMLHASLNTAEYILGTELSKRHYVVVDGKELVEVSDNAVRLARYLSLVDRVLGEHPEILNELSRHSLEYKLLKRKSST
ncbi:MAG: 4Fe-4S ferredoxin [Desulfurococcales archaeon]|nr:4Fe-4S ferredoxin [Desulfurococcales archaeon]